MISADARFICPTCGYCYTAGPLPIEDLDIDAALRRASSVFRAKKLGVRC